MTENMRYVAWEDRSAALNRKHDLVINLEDSLEVAEFVRAVQFRGLFGAYLDSSNLLRYTDNASSWFDLSLISRHGKAQADRLKYQTRRAYQDMIFSGVGFSFTGEPYLLPEPMETGLSGDVAMAVEAGSVWPMKRWAYYGELKERLEAEGLAVNVLSKRTSLLEHFSDVRNHRCLVSGDTLPMHFALGSEVPCVSLFTYTSPWEIYDYGVQTKIVSPLLEEFFYKRGYDERATRAITVHEVFDAVMMQLKAAVPAGTVA